MNTEEVKNKIIEQDSNDLEFNKQKQELLKEMENSKIKILDIEQSLLKIANNKGSICRFGDGELDIILGKDLGFQKTNPKLAKMLAEILKEKQDFCNVGIPDAINNYDNITEDSIKFWVKNMARTRNIWLEYLHEDMEYCTANLTRLYIRYKDKSNCGKYFAMLKNIWQDRNVIICEGEQTRVGVGNNLLDNCKSVTRILCPSENAFDKYEEILETLKKEDKESLFLIALGPTATILSYNLAKCGYQALDIGHFDIEYEWYLRGASKKEKIENKYTNEVVGGNSIADINNERYNNQIKKVIK